MAPDAALASTRQNDQAAARDRRHRRRTRGVGRLPRQPPPYFRPRVPRSDSLRGREASGEEGRTNHQSTAGGLLSTAQPSVFSDGSAGWDVPKSASSACAWKLLALLAI